jgi:CubicO group peptidase (beta-lactamase class C family)
MGNSKNKIHYFAASVVIIVCLVVNCPAQHLAGKIDQYMKDAVKEGKFSGSILVAQNGNVLVTKGYGMANIEMNAPNTPQTKFRIGSLTKQFTAMAIMILQEYGKLNVQDTICKYVSQCPAAWQKITMHHVLTHTSGIPDISNSPEFGTIALSPISAEKLIERFKNLPLEYKPGEKFSYNNVGYLLLGYIVEKASNRRYEAFLKEKIFQPLNMFSSGVDHHELILKHRACGYARQGDATVNAPYIYISNLEGGGSLYSTVEDMFLWGHALSNEKLVSKKTLDAIFTPYIATPFGADYGYGWFVHKDKSDRRVIGHTGGINGFRSRIVNYPEERILVIILSNLSVTPVDEIANDLAGMVLGQRD